MNGWESRWRELIGLPEAVPGFVTALLALVIIYLAFILPSAAVYAYVERKFGADLQARVGPNRQGPAGLFQPIADLLKLLQKASPGRRGWREQAWMGLHVMALYSTVAVLPLGSLFMLVDTDMSALIPFWAAWVLALGTMLLGLEQRSVPGWFGGLRVAAQALAGGFPALVAILTAAVRTGGFRWSEIAAAQGASPLDWNALSDPFQFLAFFVFLGSGLVLLSVTPLDAGLSAGDIHGGVSSHLSGRRLNLFRLGRYYGFLLWSVISATLFLGAWRVPEGIRESLLDSGAVGAAGALEVGALFAKTLAIMLLMVWLGRVNPRVRVDQITDFAWRVLSPLALFALTGAAVWGVLA
jgi:NADH-quinone oxidoreductase subunit H